jgi:hypothetical protein
LVHFVMEFENRADLDKAVSHLWDRLGVTGETSIRPAPGGHWMLEVSSEKSLREKSLARLNGKLLESSGL